MVAQVKREKKIIGRKEKIHFVQHGLRNMIAKIDTGAYSSSLHCHILSIEQMDGVEYVKFIPLVYKNRVKNAHELLVPVSKKKVVKSSSGHAEERYFVKLEVQLNGHAVTTEFSLTDRSNMRHTILLGRKFLKGHYIVDVSRKFVLAKIKKKKS
jgi:hypothetical protein